MKILIVSTIVPFVEGGGSLIVDWLTETFKKYGYDTDVLKLPFHSYPPEMMEQMLALRLLDLSDYADLLIAIRTPSYIISHPNKVVWFIHHHRGAYDLWGTPYQDIPSTQEGFKIREAIIRTDNIYLREAKKIFTNSKVMSDRLKKFNNLESEVLYPPLMNADSYYCSNYGDYIFYPSRITTAKRQALAVESMKYTKSGVKLIIAGKPDVPAELDRIKSIIEKNKLEDKVEIIGRWISQEEKIELLANSLGCVYIPLEEDSYGYVSLEAYQARKPIITCSDSGGTREIVENGIGGFILPPDPIAIAGAMDTLFYNNNLSKKMGEAGFAKMRSMNISWDHVVKRLTA